MNERLYPDPIRLSLAAIDAEHEAGYTVDRPVGGDTYLFVFFDTPVLLADENGRRSYSGGVFILYAPGAARYFRAEEPLTHTWFQVAGSGVAACIERYGIPVNRAVAMPHPAFLAPLLREAQRHLVRKQRHTEDAVTESVRSLFRHLARSLYRSEDEALSPYQRQLCADLLAVRAQVYRDLQRRWSVDDMAALASMSAQRFAVAYRACFGTSPIDDLIDVRLRHVEMLLRRLPLAVADAAICFGFPTGSNFHVLFRERMGRSPRGFARTGERLSVPVADLDDLLETSEAARRVALLYIRPVGYWSFDRLEEEAPVADDLGKHPPAEVRPEIARRAGRHGGYALQLDGHGYVAVPGAVADTRYSYTVSAWLALDLPGRMTAVSLGNHHHGAFYLQYIEADGGFKFAVTVSERDPYAIYVVSSAPAGPETWTHVVGVHDAEAREIRLYVNGRLTGRTRYDTPWRADGPLYLGCCQVMDTVMDHWRGAIDDVRIYDRALSGAEVEILYHADGDLAAGDGSGGGEE